MALFDSSLWTGRKDYHPTVEVKEREVINTSVPALAAPEKTPMKSAPIPDAPVDAMREAVLKEYAELAEYVGIMPPDLTIEAFKSFLRDSGMTVFQLADVIDYMDKKAAKESKEQAGWEWRPLREKDHREAMMFGRAASSSGQHDRSPASFDPTDIRRVPASDYYQGPHKVLQGDITGRVHEWTAPGSSSKYDRTIPIHAVRKIAQIEKGFKGDVAFFVCDYALAPTIQYPDPFLMVVVPNPGVSKGIGRFIIDFWDEPGFGIEHMVKSDL